MADAKFEDFFGAGGGGVGLFPVFPPATIWGVYNGGRPAGFVGNGDYIDLSLSAGALRYYNNANALVWSKVPADVAVGCDYWLTFSLDTVDNLLWVFAINTTTEAVYTATVNSAGTVVVKGSFTSTRALGAADGWPNAGAGAQGGSGAWRSAQGVGNFTLVTTDTVYVVDYTNGAKVSETTLAGLSAGAFPVPGGRYVLTRDVEVERETAVTVYVPSPVANRVLSSTIHAPRGVGLPYTSGQNTDITYVALNWAGYVYLRSPGLNGVFNSVYDRLEFAEACDSLISNYRLDQ